MDINELMKYHSNWKEELEKAKEITSPEDRAIGCSDDSVEEGTSVNDDGPTILIILVGCLGCVIFIFSNRSRSESNWSRNSRMYDNLRVLQITMYEKELESTTDVRRKLELKRKIYFPESALVLSQ